MNNQNKFIWEGSTASYNNNKDSEKNSNDSDNDNKDSKKNLKASENNHKDSQKNINNFLEKQGTFVDGSMIYANSQKESLSNIPSIFNNDNNNSGYQQLYTNTNIEQSQVAQASDNQFEDTITEFQESIILNTTPQNNPSSQQSIPPQLASFGFRQAMEQGLTQYLNQYHSMIRQYKEFNDFINDLTLMVTMKQISNEFAQNVEELKMEQNYKTIFVYAIEKVVIMALAKHKRLAENLLSRNSNNAELYLNNVNHWLTMELPDYIKAAAALDQLTSLEIIYACQANQHVYNSYLKEFLMLIDLTNFDYKNLKDISDPNMKKGFRVVTTHGWRYQLDRPTKNMTEKYQAKAMALKILFCHIHNQFYNNNVSTFYNINVHTFYKDVKTMALPDIEQIIPQIVKLVFPQFNFNEKYCY